MPYIRSTTLAALALAGATLACSDSGPTLAPSQARISIDAGIAGQLTAGLSASVAGTEVAISPDTVKSLTIQFTDVAFLPVGASETDGTSWQTLTLPAPVTLDLMALPHSPGPTPGSPGGRAFERGSDPPVYDRWLEGL